MGNLGTGVETRISKSEDSNTEGPFFVKVANHCRLASRGGTEGGCPSGSEGLDCHHTGSVTCKIKVNFFFWHITLRLPLLECQEQAVSICR